MFGTFSAFSLITKRLAPSCAIGFHRIRFFQLMTLKSQGTYIPDPDWLVTDRWVSRLLHNASMLRVKAHLRHLAFEFKFAISPQIRA
jgi:hypothetical protein